MVASRLEEFVAHLSLAVSGFGAVLAVEVELVDVRGQAGFRCAEQGAAESQASDVFHDIGVFKRGCGGFSPGEGSMAGAEDAWNFKRI